MTLLDVLRGQKRPFGMTGVKIGVAGETPALPGCGRAARVHTILVEG
jgi:hypothetical protein